MKPAACADHTLDAVAQALFKARRTFEEEPEPETPATSAIACCQATQTQRVPIALPSHYFTAGALTRDVVPYVVWRLGDCPLGEHHWAGVHFGREVWSGLRGVLATADYHSGRDRLRRVAPQARASPLRAACTLYLSEASQHQSPRDIQLFLWL
eukprot:3002273-Amphidinium_carterae.2